MADSKITALTAITTVNPATYPLVIVDTSDTSMAITGTTKKVTTNQLLGSGGTATLASATITGDLTVATSVLKVDTANTRVGINTTSINGGPFNVKISPAIDAKFVVQDGFTTGNVRLAAVDNAYSTYKIMDFSALSYAWYNSGSTAMTLNSTGLGVGGVPSYKLDVQGTSAGVLRLVNILNLSTDPAAVTRLSLDGQGATWHLDNERTNGIFKITRNSTACLTIDNSANVGIGVTPSAWGSGGNIQGTNGFIWSSYDASVGAGYYYASGSYKYISTAAASIYQPFGGTHKWFTAAGGQPAGTNFTPTQAMTLDASGRLVLGITAAYNAARLTVQSAGGAGGINTSIQNDNDTYYAINFRNSVGTSCGSISCLTSSTAFNTSSDYRLKEAVQPLAGGLARVSALKPSIYKWKADGSSGEGFLAHELAEVVPFAVTGEKDAVNEDGSIKPQGVDLSKIVPVLVAAIQELAAEVNTLKNA